MGFVLCCSHSPKILPHSFWILQKCSTFEGCDTFLKDTTHTQWHLKSTSNIATNIDLSFGSTMEVKLYPLFVQIEYNLIFPRDWVRRWKFELFVFVEQMRKIVIWRRWSGYHAYVLSSLYKVDISFA